MESVEREEERRGLGVEDEEKELAGRNRDGDSGLLSAR